MENWKDRLAQVETPVRVAIIGSGQVGHGLAELVRGTPGLRLVALADMIRDRAEECAQVLDMPYRLVDTPEQQALAIRCGQVAVCEDGEMAAGSGLADVVIDSTGAAYSGARHAEVALRTGANVAMVNLAADLAFGPWLLSLAQAMGRVYTCACAGRAAAAASLLRDVSSDNTQPIATGFSCVGIDQAATQDDGRTAVEVAEADGTAVAAELAALANAIGAVVPADMLDTPIVTKEAQILAQALDHSNKHLNLSLAQSDTEMAYAILQSEDGRPTFNMHDQPFQTGAQDALDCVVSAALDGTARLAPWAGMRATVTARAKRDLQAGERLDGAGGWATYGRIEPADANAPYAPDEGLPMMLSDGLTLRRPVAAGARIRLSDCLYSENDARFKLWRKSQNCGNVKADVAAE